MSEVPMPRLLEPMLARSATRLPAGAGWGYEFKWDGYRAILYVDRGRRRLLSRRRADYTARVPELAPLAAELADRRAILDGELVALTAGGRPSFQALQLRIGPRGLVAPAHGDPPASTLAYLAFDLLYLDGKSLLSLPYADRRQQLERLNLSGPSWWTPPFTLNGEQFLEESQTLHYEGVIAKKLASPYRPGSRTGDWLKVKIPRRELAVIAGWMPSDVQADRVGSLVLARYDVARPVASRTGRRQQLLYAGRVGTGFTQRMLDQLRPLLMPLRTEASLLDRGGPPPGAHFVRPELVCEVAFRELTLAGEVRHASFQGIRPDAEPTEVAWEG
jgi:bifunctional non-homologous end joining protein LigD